MLGKLVNILRSSRRVPFRAINKSRKSLFVVAATCIILTIFATFFQSKDIVFFYDKLILTDESVQVPYDVILSNRNQLEKQRVWLTQDEYEQSTHKYGLTELNWRRVNNKVGFEPNVNDVLVDVLNMARPNMTRIEYIGFGCGIGKTVFLLDHVLHDSLLTCIDADPFTAAATSYFGQQTHSSATERRWTSERANQITWLADSTHWPQTTLAQRSFLLIHARGFTTAKSLHALAERVEAAELNGRALFVVIEDVDPSDPAVSEALLDVWRASNIQGEFGALVAQVVASTELQLRKVFFVGAQSLTDALLAAQR